MKRFDQLSQGYKKSDTPTGTNGERKPRTHEKKSLEDTKKHLGFQWDVSNK